MYILLSPYTTSFDNTCAPVQSGVELLVYLIQAVVVEHAERRERGRDECDGGERVERARVAEALVRHPDGGLAHSTLMMHFAVFLQAEHFIKPCTIADLA